LAVFDMSRYISKTVQDTAIVTVEDEQQLVCNLPTVAFPMTLSEPNLDFKVTILFNVK